MKPIRFFSLLLFLLSAGLAYSQTVPKTYCPELVKLAGQGDAEAQYNLGRCYANGDGVILDFSEAVKWYAKAAEQGNAGAQFNLGLCYYYGSGVKKSISKAVNWWRKSAEQGNALAQYRLGRCYQNGKGVPKDYQKALEYFNLAAEQGYERAIEAIQSLSETPGSGTNSRSIPESYCSKLLKLAKKGDPKAQFNLGLCYATGKGVLQDYSEAVKWLRKSADQGVAEAQYNLGACYANGHGLAKDYQKALEYYRLAAAQGYKPAIEALESLGENP